MNNKDHHSNIVIFGNLVTFSIIVLFSNMLQKKSQGHPIVKLVLNIPYSIIVLYSRTYLIVVLFATSAL